MAKQRVVDFQIPPQLDDEIEALVKAGRYGSKSELLRSAVRKLLDAER